MTQTTLTPEDLDAVGEALITLTQEVWIAKDRQRILEALLIEKGVLTADEVDLFEPQGDLKTGLAADRQAFVDAVLGALRSSNLSENS